MESADQSGQIQSRVQRWARQVCVLDGHAVAEHVGVHRSRVGTDYEGGLGWKVVSGG